jgi:16S rRNA processing protein RimM
VAFDGVDDATAAQVLVGATLAIDRRDVALDDGEYFDDDLVGCALVDAGGVVLAEVVAVEHYPAQDVLLVALPRGAGRAMVPMVRAFVKSIDIGARRISVELPPGLLDSREADEA